MLKQLRNIFIVWLLTGLWHGASWNFVIWGLYYCVLLVLEQLFLGRILKKLPAAVGHIYTLFMVNLGWVIFAYDSLGDIGTALGNMFGANGLSLTNNLTVYTVLSYGVFLVIAIIGATPAPSRIGTWIIDRIEGVYVSVNDMGEAVKERLTEREHRVRFAAAAVFEMLFLLGIFVLSTAFLASEAFNPFLYFRF
jgi:alginate O-acetyltransferase complex protein AlgI